jgi:hypothetical protein
MPRYPRRRLPDAGCRGPPRRRRSAPEAAAPVRRADENGCVSPAPPASGGAAVSTFSHLPDKP